MAKISCTKGKMTILRAAMPHLIFMSFASFDKDVSIEDVVDQLIYDLKIDTVPKE
jgi:predicted peroxiredoxin